MGRMEKHLSEEGGLLPVAWKALVKVLYEWFGRWEKLSSQIYKHVLEPSAVDVVRIAKAAGASNRQDDRIGSTGRASTMDTRTASNNRDLVPDTTEELWRSFDFSPQNEFFA